MSEAAIICATVVDPKLDFYIVTPVTLKMGQTRGESVRTFMSDGLCQS